MSESLTHADVRVYAYLLWRAGGKSVAWPNVDTIARETRMSEQAVRISLKSLILNNWIYRHRRFGSSSITHVFEYQKDCIEFARSANLLADDPLTHEPTISQQDSRENESNRTRVKELGEKKPRPRNEMFDVLVEVTNTDPKAANGYVGRTAADLKGYSPADVRKWYSRGGWWYTTRCKGIENPPAPSLKSIATTIKLASESDKPKVIKVR